MNLCVFLSIGESFADLKSKGQDELIINYLLKNYSRNFKNVYVFSYANESFTVFGNVHILPNRYSIHRYIYCFLLPFAYRRYIQGCSVIRGLQLTGGIPGLVSRLLYRKKYVINYGYDYVRFAMIEKKPFQAMLYKMIERILLKHASGIIVTTRGLGKDLNKYGLENKIQLISNGVDTDVFRPLPMKKSNSIIYVGRLEPQKNLKMLIEALGMINSRKVHLIFIGNGSQRDELLRLAVSKSINLTIISSMSHKKLPRRLNRALVFVLPSIIEGQPKVLLEAMSCSIPVIVSDIPAHREIISHGYDGILTRSDAASFFEAIMLLLRDQNLRDTLSQNARKTVIKRFSMINLNKKEIQFLMSVTKL